MRKKDCAMVPGVQWREALFLFGHFLQTEECTTEELCRPYLWAGNQGHMGWPRRVCFPRSHVGPMSCLSSRLWAPRIEGRGQRSRQAESSRWAPLPVAKPRVPQNSDKWSQGGLAGSGQLDSGQGLGLKRVSCGAGAQLCPPHLSARSLPGAGPSSPAAGGTYTVLTLLCHQLGEFSKRSQCGIAPTPQPRTSLPFPGISEPRAAGP